MSKETEELIALTEQGAQLNQAAACVLAREDYGKLTLSPRLCPVANLAFISEFMLDWGFTHLRLSELLMEAGLSKAKVRTILNGLVREGEAQETLVVRLVREGADPMRLRDMTLSEATEYLAGFLVKLH